MKALRREWMYIKWWTQNLNTLWLNLFDNIGFWNQWLRFLFPSLARTFGRCICSPEKAHANKPKNSCGQPPTMDEWAHILGGNRRRRRRWRRTKKAKIIITIKMVRCIIPPSWLSSSSSSSAASLCVYFGLNVHSTGFSPFLFVTATRFLFQFDVLSLSFPFTANRTHSTTNVFVYKMQNYTKSREIFS